MGDVVVARQPILDGQLDIVGYELLFRDGPASTAVVASAEAATAAVVLGSFTEIGLERIVGPHAAWINLSRSFALKGMARTLPPGRVVLELLEDQLIDEELVAAVRELVDAGHRLALDDFRYEPDLEPLLELAHIVKLDLLALGREGMAAEVERLRPYGLTLLAEKVETHEDWAYCASLGCELFQGYFFCRPEPMRGRRVDTHRLSLLKVVAALEAPDVELRDVESLIVRDVRLSYRLLRYINSAFFGLRHPVGSIGQALVLLGTENVRQWAALTIFASIDDKPAVLTVIALVRARFCELAGEARQLANRSELFTLGLFSVIDALMDAPLEDLLETIPFPADMRAALTEQRGEMGRLLRCVTALEAGDFELAEAIMPGGGKLYVAAIAWATSAADAVFDTGGGRRTSAAPRAATAAL